MSSNFDNATSRPSHPLAGQTVEIRPHAPVTFRDGALFVVEDWWENLDGERWTVSCLGGRPAALIYGLRAVDNESNLRPEFEPVDDVVYGKIGAFGHILHDSELVR